MRILALVACFWLATSPLWGKIVFYSERDGNHEIYRMDSDGSNVTRLTHQPASDAAPAWSPNGQQIAFHSDRDGNPEVYVMDADGGNQRRLTRHPGLMAFRTGRPMAHRLRFIVVGVVGTLIRKLTFS